MQAAEAEPSAVQAAGNLEPAPQAGQLPMKVEAPPEAAPGGGPKAAGSSGTKAEKAKLPRPEGNQECPRCASEDTKFCYYNNYNIKQPRYFCRACQRYWTAGGALRDVPPGAGRRKSKAAGSKSEAPSNARGVPDVLVPPTITLAANVAPMSSGIPTVLPHIPFIDSALAAYGVTSINFAAPPGIVDSMMGPAVAATVGARQLPSNPEESLAHNTANALLTDPTASAFQPVQPGNSDGPKTAVAVVGGAAAAGAQPAGDATHVAAEAASRPQLSDDAQHAPCAKRLKAESVVSGNSNGTADVATVAATAAGEAANGDPTYLAQPQTTMCPMSAPTAASALAAPTSQALPATDGLGLGTAGPLSADWLNMHIASSSQQAVQLQAAQLQVAAAGLGPAIYPNVWPMCGSFGMPHGWLPNPRPQFPPAPPLMQVPTCNTAVATADAAGMVAAMAANGSVPASSAPFPSQYDLAAQPPSMPVPPGGGNWSTLPVAGGGLGCLPHWTASLPGGMAMPTGGVPWGGMTSGVPLNSLANAMPAGTPSAAAAGLLGGPGGIQLSAGLSNTGPSNVQQSLGNSGLGMVPQPTASTAAGCQPPTS